MGFGSGEDFPIGLQIYLAFHSGVQGASEHSGDISKEEKQVGVNGVLCHQYVILFLMGGSCVASSFSDVLVDQNI